MIFIDGRLRTIVSVNTRLTEAATLGFVPLKMINNGRLLLGGCLTIYRGNPKIRPSLLIREAISKNRFKFFRIEFTPSWLIRYLQLASYEPPRCAVLYCNVYIMTSFWVRSINTPSLLFWGLLILVLSIAFVSFVLFFKWALGFLEAGPLMRSTCVNQFAEVGFVHLTIEWFMEAVD